MKKYSVLFIVMILSGSSFYGCATVFTGYENRVMLTGMPEEYTIYDNDNIEMEVHETSKKSKFFRSSIGYFDSTVVTGSYISLRSNTDHVLLLKSKEGEKKIHLYPKLSAGWFLLDIVTVTFPIDLYTGNWNHFDDVDYRNIK